MTDPEQFDPREYWEHRLAARYNLAGVGHAGFPHSYNRWLYRVRGRVFRRMAKRLNIHLESARVLDIGSGTGFYIDLWQSAGVAVIEGMDIAPTAVANLRRRFPGARFHQGDVGAPGTMAGLEGHFDIISAMDIMFHIVDNEAYARALRNVHTALREGGLFIFSDNFLHGPEKRVRHIVHRRLPDVRGLLEDTGFEVVARRPMFTLMTTPVDTNSRLALGAWTAISRAARCGEMIGWITGALLYPVELALTALRTESATTELMVCRREPEEESL